MAQLGLSLVEDIGRTTAKRVIGDDFDAMHVTAGADHTGQDAYFFTFRFRDTAIRNRAGKLSVDLSMAIRDELFRRGDESFSFVRMLSTGHLAHRDNAAAE